MGVTHAGTGAFRAAGRQHQDGGRQDSSDWRLQGDYFGSATRAPQPVTLSLEGGALQIVPTTLPRMWRHFSLVQRAGKWRSPALQAFVDACHAVAAEAGS